MTVFKRAGEEPRNEQSGAPYHKPAPLPQARHPQEICPGDPECRALSQKSSAQMKYLSGRMGPEDIGRFQKLEDLCTQSNAYYAFVCFRWGFHLGYAYWRNRFSGSNPPGQQICRMSPAYLLS